jgi:hypothetical protein
MTKQSLALCILVTLYRAASRGRCLTESTLSKLTSIDKAALEILLLELDRAAFVDREQLRLTLAGLAVAVAASKKPKIRSLAWAA